MDPGKNAVARAMLKRPPDVVCAKLVFSALVAAAVGVPGVALAQTTTTTSGATVSQSGQPYPARLHPERVGMLWRTRDRPDCVSTRPANLTPLGISYHDCTPDQILQFSVLLTGFDGSENLQVWASTHVGLHRADGPRHAGRRGGRLLEGGAAICAARSSRTPQTYTFNVRVQDLVGWQEHPPFPAAVCAAAHCQRATACNAQAELRRRADERELRPRRQRPATTTDRPTSTRSTRTSWALRLRRA